jgi:osmotically-inducible protein OsmY
MTQTVAPHPPAAENHEDNALGRRVERALCATGYGAMRGVRVAALGRLVTLAGRVPSYHLKQVAQAAALAVTGVGRVRNELDVIRPG